MIQKDEGRQTNRSRQYRVLRFKTLGGRALSFISVAQRSKIAPGTGQALLTVSNEGSDGALPSNACPVLQKSQITKSFGLKPRIL